MTAPVSKALAVFSGQSLPAQETITVSDLLADTMVLRAEQTRNAYGSDLRAFAKFVGADDWNEAIQRLVASPSTVANSVALAYQAFMRTTGGAGGRGLAPATINRRIAALRSVMKIAAAAGLTTTRLDLVKVMRVEQKTRDTRGPGLEVVRNVLQVCDDDRRPVGLRDGAMLRWFILLGLRRNEMRTVRLEDCRFDGDPPSLWVEQKSFRARQPVALGEGIVAVVRPWLEARGDAPGPLFCSFHRGVPKNSLMGKTSLNGIVTRRAIEAGYLRARLPDGRRITPHALRHTAITKVAREQGLLAAQAFARHQDPKTTNTYVDETERHAMAAQELILGEL